MSVSGSFEGQEKKVCMPRLWV